MLGTGGRRRAACIANMKRAIDASRKAAWREQHSSTRARKIETFLRRVHSMRASTGVAKRASHRSCSVLELNFQTPVPHLSAPAQCRGDSCVRRTTQYAVPSRGTAVEKGQSVASRMVGSLGIGSGAAAVPARRRGAIRFSP